LQATLPFTEMGPLCGLEEKHRVDLGTEYKMTEHVQRLVNLLPKNDEKLYSMLFLKQNFSVFKQMSSITYTLSRTPEGLKYAFQANIQL